MLSSLNSQENKQYTLCLVHLSLSLLNKVHCNAASTMPYDLSRFFSILLLWSCFEKKRSTKKRGEKICSFEWFLPLRLFYKRSILTSDIVSMMLQEEKKSKQFSFEIVINNVIYLRGGGMNGSILNIDKFISESLYNNNNINFCYWKTDNGRNLTKSKKNSNWKTWLYDRRRQQCTGTGNILKNKISSHVHRIARSFSLSSSYLVNKFT